MLNEPLVLFGSPRGGTSVIAGIFAAHGLWTGKTFGGPGGVGSGGYVNHENAALKAFMKEHWPLDAGNHNVVAQKADLRAFCEQVVPEDTDWMFKGTTEYHPVWAHWFPSAVHAFIIRNKRQAIEAHVRRRGEQVRDVATRVVEERYQYIAKMAIDHEIPVIDSDAVVLNEDYQAIENILNQFSISLDTNLIDACVDRNRWTT